MLVHRKTLLIIAVVVALCASRLLFLTETARFTRDESSDLARMHAYWQAKKITLVGPISNDNVKVFSSLTYYMQMPFAVLYDFAPVGPVVGTAFWGALTILLVLKTIKPSLSFVLLAILWTPLLTTSRWAWNPHLVPFWIALALFVRNTRWKWRYLPVGLAFGLSLHNHYIAAFAVGVFSFVDAILLIKKRAWRDVLLLGIGFILAITPFVLFDLRHPPGLFLGSYLQSSAPNVVRAEDIAYAAHLLRNFTFALTEIVGPVWLQVFWLPIFVGLLIYDYKKMRKNLLYILPVFAQIIGPIIVDGYHQRYFLPATIFLLLWFSLPRKNYGKKLRHSLVLMTLVGSILRLPAAFSPPAQVAPMSVVTSAGREIVDIFAKNTVKNPNIAVITGSDLDSMAEKYRDLLSIDGISFRAASEYDASENLFVISTEAIENVRKDQNVSMQLFRDARLLETRALSDTPWKLYWFGI